MSRPLTILQMLPELNVGGVEQGVMDSARGYAARGHRSLVVSGGGRLVPQLEADGSSHFCLPVHKKNPFTALSMISRVAQLMKTERVDIVHARSRVPAWIGYFASDACKVPFVTTVHGFYSPGFYSRIMVKGERVIAVSRAMAEYAVERLHADPERLRVVLRGTEPDRFALNRTAAQKKAYRKQLGLPESGPVVAIIGRITRLKGHGVFLSAMQQVVARMPELTPLVVGSVPPKKAAYEAELMGLTGKLGLTERVVYAGSRSDIPDLLQVVDLVVNCSTQPESFGRTLIEAMAAGVPVVAAAHGGALDIVEDGVTGRLVPPGDAEALALAVREILESGAGPQMGKAGAERVKSRFTVDAMVDGTLEVYREVCRETLAARG